MLCSCFYERGKKEDIYELKLIWITLGQGGHSSGKTWHWRKARELENCQVNQGKIRDFFYLAEKRISGTG